MNDDTDVVVKIPVNEQDAENDGARPSESMSMFERMRQTIFGSSVKEVKQVEPTTPMRKIEDLNCNAINIEAFSVQSSRTNYEGKNSFHTPGKSSEKPRSVLDDLESFWEE